jgi:hypothetical protein
MIMQRPYQDVTSSHSVKLFVGEEVENSPMKNKPTLFVVGIQCRDEIIAACDVNQVDHIYLGANHSFDPTTSGSNSDLWNDLIWNLLNTKRFWVTLDFDLAHLTWVQEGGYCESHRFVPMISVKMPHVAQLNYNTTIKIDDVGFDSTNPGVWCHSLHSLTTRSSFTDWTQYKQDQPI